MTIHYFIFAGESSGDLHGSRLMQALQQKSCTIAGVGGPAMRAQGIACVLKMEEFQVMGLSDVLKSLPKLYKQFYIILNAILMTKPDCVILIDYPGFNLRLAKKLRQKGFKGKIVQYVCPTVWAHGEKRIAIMAKTLDLLVTIFPFEPSYFSHTSLNVKYVGNPLVEHIETYTYDTEWKKQFAKPLIALFPGSRIGEIQRNLSLQIQAAILLKQKHPNLNFAVSYSQDHLLPIIRKIIDEFSFECQLVPRQFTYELMQHCDMALAKSGTVTLELALHRCPTVVVYQLTTLNYLFAKYLLKLHLPHYCIVNIMSKSEVFPELIGKDIQPQHLCTQLEKLYSDKKIRANVRQGCEQICNSLGRKNAHQGAAKAVWELLKC
jgi:lipid-A-disaccharide synthase